MIDDLNTMTNFQVDPQVPELASFDFAMPPGVGRNVEMVIMQVVRSAHQCISHIKLL